MALVSPGCSAATCRLLGSAVCSRCYRAPVLARMASLCVAYLLWAVGGWLGLHHLYLGRDRQALVWWCLPGGYFGLGWARDLWRMPEYVREANRELGWLELQEEKMKGAEQPPWKMARWGGMLVVGNMLGMLPGMAVPGPEELGGTDLKLLGTLLTPLGCALGIWLVGNIGRWQGGLGRPLLGCYLTLPAYLWGWSVVSWTTIIGRLLAITIINITINVFINLPTPRCLRLPPGVAAGAHQQPAAPLPAARRPRALRRPLPRPLVLLPLP